MQYQQHKQDFYTMKYNPNIVVTQQPQIHQTPTNYLDMISPSFDKTQTYYPQNMPFQKYQNEQINFPNPNYQNYNYQYRSKEQSINPYLSHHQQQKSQSQQNK